MILKANSFSNIRCWSKNGRQSWHWRGAMFWSWDWGRPLPNSWSRCCSKCFFSGVWPNDKPSRNWGNDI
jgi:hypothetical protein